MKETKVLSCRFLSAAVMAILLSGCEWLSPVSEAEHISRAREFQDKGDFRTSSIELKNAIGMNPDNPESRRLLGEVNIELGNGADAEKELRRALALGVAREAILPKLAEALLLQGKNQAILDEIDLPQTIDDATRSILQTIRGNAWMAFGDVNKAAEEFDAAVASDAKNARAILGQANVAFGRQELQKVESLTAEALKIAPKEPKVWAFLGEFYRSQGELEKSEDAYTQAIDNRKDNLLDRAHRALVRFDLGKYEEVRKDVDSMKKEKSDFFLANLLDGLLHLKANELPEAQAALELSLRNNERYLLTPFYLGVTHLLQNHLEEADHYLKPYAVPTQKHPTVVRMLALLRYQQSDFKAAKALLGPLLERFPNEAPLHQLMAQIEYGLGNDASGLSHLEKSVELAPDSAGSRFQLGLGLISAGQSERGIEMLDALSESQPDQFQPDVVLALALIKGGQFEKAGAVIDRLEKKSSGDVAAQNLRAMILIAQKKPDEARALLEQSLQREPGEALATKLLAKLLVGEKKYQEAQVLVEAALKRRPKSLEFQLNLAELLSAQQQIAKMIVTLQNAMADFPDALPPRLTLAQIYNRIGATKKSETILLEKRERFGGIPDYLAALIEAQVQNAELIKASENTQDLLKIAPNSVNAWLLAAKVHQERQDLPGMKRDLEMALKLEPNNLSAQVFMVRVLVLEQKVAEAKTRLAQLVREQPEAVEVIGLQAWVAAIDNRPEDAVKSFLTVFEKSPSTMSVGDLARAQWTAGQREQAARTLEEWRTKYPDDHGTDYLLTLIYSDLGRSAESTAILENLVKARPNDVYALNDLAWALKDLEPGRALELAEKAVSLAPKAPLIVDTLAMILLQRNQQDRALTMLKQANALGQNHPLLQYHLALALSKNGRNDEAIAELKSALKGSQPFDGRKDAEAMLKNLLGQ